MVKLNKQKQDIYRGLNSIDVKNSFNRYGTNTYNDNKDYSHIDKFIVCLANPNITIICLVLFINIIFMISTCYWYKYIGIIVVLLVTMIFTIMFRYALSLKYKNIIDSKLNIIENHVWRNGHIILIPQNEIVVGDFVQLSKGDILPADGILIKGKLSVNQHTLNNNINDISKKISMDDYNEYDMKDDDLLNPNMLFRMSKIKDGTGTMLVTHIGKETYCYKNNCDLDCNKQKEFEEMLNFNIDSYVKKASKVGYMLAFISMFVYLYNCVFINNNFYIVDILKYINSLDFACCFFNSIVLVLTLILVLVPQELKSITKIIFCLNYNMILKNKELTNLFGICLYNKLSNSLVRKIILLRSIVCYTLVIFNIISMIIFGFLAINVTQILWIYVILYFIIYLAYTNNISCENILYNELNKDNVFNLNLNIYAIIFSTCFILFSLLFFCIPLEKNVFRFAQNSIYIRTGYFNVFVVWVIFLSIIIKLHGKTSRLSTRWNYIFLFIICFVIITQVFIIYFENFIFNTISLNMLELKFTVLYAILIILFSVVLDKRVNCYE